MPRLPASRVTWRRNPRYVIPTNSGLMTGEKLSGGSGGSSRQSCILKSRRIALNWFAARKSNSVPRGRNSRPSSTKCLPSVPYLRARHGSSCRLEHATLHNAKDVQTSSTPVYALDVELLAVGMQPPVTSCVEVKRCALREYRSSGTHGMKHG